MKKFSTVLNQEIEYNESGVLCSDGVLYSFDELKNIKECDTEQKRYLHKIKKMFNGVVI